MRAVGHGGEFARIHLTGAMEMSSHQTLVQRLGSDAKAWLKSIDTALNRNQVSLAWALQHLPHRLWSHPSSAAPGTSRIAGAVVKSACLVRHQR